MPLDFELLSAIRSTGLDYTWHQRETQDQIIAHNRIIERC